MGSLSSQQEQQYQLEVIDGKVHWSHKNDQNNQIFDIQTGAIISKNTWYHFAVTYDAEGGEAKIYVDGVVQTIGIGHGELSQDWGTTAGFGNHLDGKPLYGFIDDIYFYTTALTRDELISYVKKFRLKLKTPPPVTIKLPQKPKKRPPAKHKNKHKPTHKVPPTYEVVTKRPTHSKTTETQHKTETINHTEKLNHHTTRPLTKIPPTHKRNPTSKPTTKQIHTTIKKKLPTPKQHVVTHHVTMPTTRPTTKTAPKANDNTTTTTFATTTTTKTTITKTLATTTTPLVTIPLKTTPLTTAVTTTKTIAITSPPVCKFGNTYLYTDLKGGLVSGNFLDRGLTSGIKPCMELCCAHRTCDLAYVVSGRCYLVECYTEDLCSIVPKGIGLITPTIGMVVRPNGPKSKSF